MKRDFPFPAYPNGWFAVSSSDEVKSGEVKPLDYFGNPLVVYRTEAGEARVIDANCPHLGAHLGFGGAVVGETVRCPFHHWRFGADGKCVDIPYAQRIPPLAKIRVWPTCESNGFVFAWYHGEQKPPARPIPPIEEYAAPGWGDYVRFRWKVKSRMYDIGENARRMLFSD